MTIKPQVSYNTVYTGTTDFALKQEDVEHLIEVSNGN